MTEYLHTLRKLQKVLVNFKAVEGYYELEEIKIRERSGYALFQDDKNHDKKVYITVIASNRKEVIRELTNKILGKLFWTSRLDMSWIPKKN